MRESCALNISDKQAYVLHLRPYRESSLLLEFFAEDKGRFTAVSRGQKSRPQLFVPYSLTTGGRGELKSVRMLEPQAPAFRLSGRALFCAMYLNEILYRCLPKDLPENPLLSLYVSSLQKLAEDSASLESILRSFELGFFEALGFSLLTTVDQQGEKIEASCRYRFLGEEGFLRLDESAQDDTQVYPGWLLEKFVQGELQSLEERRAGKRLVRQAFRLFFDIDRFESRQFFES